MSCNGGKEEFAGGATVVGWRIAWKGTIFQILIKHPYVTVHFPRSGFEPLPGIRAGAGLPPAGRPFRSRSGAAASRPTSARATAATPRGTFRPLQLWWRADRHPRPRTFLPVRAIGPHDAWCEDPLSRHYNQPVRLDRDRGGDRLKRDDHLYDFVVEIDHNSSPRIAGRGSAVFLHLARENFSPTAGCVSMTKSAMLQLLQRLGPDTRIVIE